MFTKQLRGEKKERKIEDRQTEGGRKRKGNNMALAAVRRVKMRVNERQLQSHTSTGCLSPFSKVSQEGLTVCYSFSRLFLNPNLVLIKPPKKQRNKTHHNIRRGQLKLKAIQSSPISHYFPLAIFLFILLCTYFTLVLLFECFYKPEVAFKVKSSTTVIRQKNYLDQT